MSVNGALLTKVMDRIEKMEEMRIALELNPRDTWETTPEQMRALPAWWNQGVWLEVTPIDEDIEPIDGEHACQTAGCLAGWTALTEGRKPFMRHSNERNTSLVMAKPDDPDHLVSQSMDHRGIWRRIISVRDAAVLDLGITSVDADTLFESSNGLDNLREYVDRLLTVGTLDEDEDEDDGPDYDEDED